MTDLTPVFNQCVNIVQSEIKPQKHPQSKEQPLYLIKDSFNKECIEFYQILSNLSHFITEIKAEYLAVSDNASNSVSKDKIDEQFNTRVQQCFKKIGALETYETKRKQMIKATLQKRWFFQDGNEQDLYFETEASHRHQVLRFLMESLVNLSKTYEKMQRKRIQREKQLNSLNFQNINDDLEKDLDNSKMFTSLDRIQQDIEKEEETPQFEMSQEQIQELESENKELLNLKTAQLNQVDNIQQSILDIVNIQNELSFKLQEQGDQIDNLMDTHSQVELEVKEGNRTLNKATRRNKRGTNYLVTICILLGCLLVIVDFLKFI
ncbi:Ufe1 protein [Candida orthopsilosis Co 90-125]|uniref:Ufe1 protein n=1 Tax=Candida orthopsilosis (strain 90-125) TaxID=1136231 RepID=H8XA71_CANO9|nr:Ufe1 protein [Candida orthopsilosis Co 90-125]CCG25048.1 Ufe1 protein [Candida orthopsilosis Co 90-125]